MKELNYRVVTLVRDLDSDFASGLRIIWDRR